MKQIYYSILLLFSSLVWAQSPFVCTPSTSLSVNLPPNTFTSTQINMINQTSGTLILKWIRFSNSIPTTWACNLCDYNNCYTGVPSMGTMHPISGLTQGFIKLETNPFTYTGTGTVVIYVYASGAPTLGDTLVFNFTASGLTTVQEENQQKEEKILMLPHLIQFQNVDKLNILKITDINGRIVFEKTLLPYENEVILTNSLPAGLYIVHTAKQVYKYLKTD
ncbi:MAG: hypothetical protein NZ519_02995 [Bacteroidia bacterium]|nr:hypothetical protein [Bacteroidia bacterium]MDW8301611.1 hypothetical protein [Bacteroidia bacterium]